MIKTVKIEKVDAYIEDYCCVVSFSSELSEDPEFCLVLTRQSSESNGGNPLEDFEWNLQIDYDGQINALSNYQYQNNQLVFYFDDDAFVLELQIVQKINLENWLDFIFKNQLQ